MTGRVAISIPRTPPSLNTWLSRHWRVRERDKASWMQEINYELHRAGMPRCDHVEVAVTFRFRDRRRRDTGNYSSTFEKCLGDALRPDFIADDDAERFYVRSAKINPERGTPETLVVLDWRADEEVAA